ncbi:MAG: hypothetical protein ACN6OY_13130, partial [Pseudomonas alloputida]
FVSADEQSGGVKFTCNLEGLYKWDNSWRAVKATVYKEESGCAPGQHVDVRSAIAGVSQVSDKYVVSTRTPESGCLDGCMLEQTYEGGTDRASGCYLVKGSTTQGFCNYTLTTTGTSCAANTLSAATIGDPLTKPQEPEDTDDGTGTPTNPGCVFDCDNGGNNGTGGTGSGGGTGGTGDGGSGGSDGDGSSNGGDSGSGSGNGGDGSSGSGSGGTPGGNGSNGTGSGSGDPGTGTPCKGLNFGESGCAEYAAVQGLNGTLQASADNVKTAQDSVWKAYDDVQGDGDKVQRNAEDGLIQRFNSMLPASVSCSNPVLDFNWTVITLDVCRYSFVKQLLGWMFAVFTLIYVFRVMTSLGTNSEV